MPKIVPILCPTRAHQGAMAHTMVAIMSAIYRMHREGIYVQSNAHGYAFVRTQGLVAAKMTIANLTNQDPKDVTKARGFMIDDDILIENPEEVVNVMKEADKRGVNVVAPYLTTAFNKEGKQQTSIARYTKSEDGSPSTELLVIDEVKELKPFDSIDAAGLGFYYGDIYLDYQFHADGRPFNGEDLNMFWDLPQLKPVLAPIQVKHCKEVLL